MAMLMADCVMRDDIKVTWMIFQTRDAARDGGSGCAQKSPGH